MGTKTKKRVSRSIGVIGLRPPVPTTPGKAKKMNPGQKLKKLERLRELTAESVKQENRFEEMVKLKRDLGILG